jgi:hypothetical protein
LGRDSLNIGRVVDVERETARMPGFASMVACRRSARRPEMIT